MMTTLNTTEARIEQVWDMCRGVYADHGRILSFPAGTDPRKTYQWRYARSLAARLDEWGFDDETSSVLLGIAVRHIKDQGLLHKGLAGLLQNNILDICLQDLKSQQMSGNQSIASIEMINKWFTQQIADQDTDKLLLHRSSPHSLRNISIWYQSSKISALFLSLSKTCCKALVRLEKLDPQERMQMPKSIDLYSIRNRFLRNKQNEIAARKILKSDWRT
jgi:hypothetical protein